MIGDWATELIGTVFGRWFVTLFAIAFVVLGRRLLGWRRLGIYTLVAFGVAVAAENGSVHFGIPFTRYAFNDALRGDELFIGSVPLFVPFSYTFVMFFAFYAARAVAAGPWRARPPGNVSAYALAVVFALWSTWTLDPVSQRGADWYIGDLFHYAGDGFWFGLPLGSQIGWFVVSAVLCGLLAVLTRADRPQTYVRPLVQNPQLGALAIFGLQVLHVSVIAIVIGDHALGAAGFLMWIPVGAVVAVLWPQLRPESTGESSDQIDARAVSRTTHDLEEEHDGAAPRVDAR